jgi:hypothetical protein
MCCSCVCCLALCVVLCCSAADLVLARTTVCAGLCTLAVVTACMVGMPRLLA